MPDTFPESARVATLLRLLASGVEMRRDDDLLRRLMLEIEANPDPLHVHVHSLRGEDEDEVEYFHLRLLVDEGFLEETGRSGGVFRMTMRGHDFVGAVRSDTAWNRTKAVAAKVSADLSISMLRDIALGLLRQELTKLGIPLG